MNRLRSTLAYSMKISDLVKCIKMYLENVFFGGLHKLSKVVKTLGYSIKISGFVNYIKMNGKIDFLGCINCQKFHRNFRLIFAWLSLTLYFGLYVPTGVSDSDSCPKNVKS